MMIHDLFFLSLNKSSLSRKRETSNYYTNVHTTVIPFFRYKRNRINDEYASVTS